MFSNEDIVDDLDKEILLANFVLFTLASILLDTRFTIQSRRGEVTKVKTSKSAIRPKKP
tara:strand:+ start:571 stop:747 length:177 start_codon:yes stop_codon:yes gene_type:complete